VNRGGEPYRSKLAPYREEEFEVAEKKAPPFYWLFNVSPSLAPHKVVWKEVSARQSKFGFETALVSMGEKPIIPDHTVVMIPLNNLSEAYYLSAILNSGVLCLASLYMVVSGVDIFKIPKFNSNNPLHKKLSELSKKAHEIAKRIYEEDREDLKEDLRKIEDEIDKTVAKLYGITDEELKEIRKCLKILKEGEVEEEEESKEEEITLPEVKDIDIKVEPLLIKENEEKELSCSIKNNLDNPIHNVKIEVLLQSKSLVKKEFKKIAKSSSKMISFKTPKLKAGEYELLINFEIDGDMVKEKRKLFVKGKKRKKKIKSALDEEIEKLLR